jgi:hypothetical protein
VKDMRVFAITGTLFFGFWSTFLAALLWGDAPLPWVVLVAFMTGVFAITTVDAWFTYFRERAGIDQ